MEGHNTWAETGFLYTFTAQPFIDRIWQYYVMLTLDMVAALKSLAPKGRRAQPFRFRHAATRNRPDIATQRAIAPERAAPPPAHAGHGGPGGVASPARRAMRHHHEGACDALRLFREGGPAIHARRAALQGLGRRASVRYCLRDHLAPANHGRCLAEQLLPRARLLHSCCNSCNNQGASAAATAATTRVHQLLQQLQQQGPPGHIPGPAGRGPSVSAGLGIQ